MCFVPFSFRSLEPNNHGRYVFKNFFHFFFQLFLNTFNRKLIENINHTYTLHHGQHQDVQKRFIFLPFLTKIHKIRVTSVTTLILSSVLDILSQLIQTFYTRVHRKHTKQHHKKRNLLLGRIPGKKGTEKLVEKLVHRCFPLFPHQNEKKQTTLLSSNKFLPIFHHFLPLADSPLSPVHRENPRERSFPFVLPKETINKYRKN